MRTKEVQMADREEPQQIQAVEVHTDESVRKGTDAFAVARPETTSMSPLEIAATTGTASPVEASPTTQANADSSSDAP
jgi:hypothetical protein